MKNMDIKWSLLNPTDRWSKTMPRSHSARGSDIPFMMSRVGSGQREPGNPALRGGCGATKAGLGGYIPIIALIS